MKFIALLINILGIPVIFMGAWMVLFSPMLFDAPDSTKSVKIWILLGCIILLPILVLVGEFFGWKHYSAGNYMASIGAYKWALLDILLILGIFMIQK